MTKLQFILTKASSQLWIQPTILSLAAIAWVAFSLFADSQWPEPWRVDIEKETLVNLFTILASTMLTVATFSVAAAASAFGSVATSATPRATTIVMSDAGVQSTLAAFLAAFIYAVVSLTALSAVDFGASGRFLLFLGFVLLVAWVLMSFLKWVDKVSRLGKLDDTLNRMADEARKAFSDPDLAGLLGGRTQAGAKRPEEAFVWRSDCFGYVQHINMEALQSLAEELEGEIWLDIRPGSFATKNGPIAVVKSKQEPDKEQLQQLQQCISTGSDRNANTDPRFAMILLSEVADRALSPSVNDPGTAITVLTLELELFHLWAENDRKNDPEKNLKFDRVYVPPLSAGDLIFDAFTPIARDGARMIEVCLRLQKALRALMHMDHAELQKAAKAYRDVALELAEQALPAKSQRQAVQDLVDKPLSPQAKDI